MASSAAPTAAAGDGGGGDAEPQLRRATLRRYVRELDTKDDTLEYWVTEHLRISGAYWGLAAMALLGAQGDMDRDATVGKVLACRRAGGGFGGNTSHDAHLLYTLSALQVLALYDAVDEVDRDETAAWIARLQQPDGSFVGDEWGECDTRFSYCALLALALLDRADVIDRAAAVQHVVRCRNFDGGFGSVPGAESHAGQVYCCVGALALCHRLDEVDADLLGWWLAERQLPCGGLNGRPEKREDVCYSWWVLSTLAVLDRTHWIDREALAAFILRCQDTGDGDGDGGFADRPGDQPDVFHTFFAVAALSLLQWRDRDGSAVDDVDPTYALPCATVRRLQLPPAQRLQFPENAWRGGAADAPEDDDEERGAEQA